MTTATTTSILTLLSGASYPLAVEGPLGATEEEDANMGGCWVKKCCWGFGSEKGPTAVRVMEGEAILMATAALVVAGELAISSAPSSAGKTSLNHRLLPSSGGIKLDSARWTPIDEEDDDDAAMPC